MSARRWIAVVPLLGLGIAAWGPAAGAGSVTMTDGTVHTGTLQPVRGITENQLLPPAGTDPELPNRYNPLLLIDSLTRRVWVGRKRVASVDDRVVLSTGRVEFALDEREPSPPRAVTSIGRVLKTGAWSDEGRRTLTLKTSTGEIDVVQAVRRISRDGLELYSPTHEWASALDVSAVPPDRLEAMIAGHIDATNPDDRLAVARFYVEAGLYPRAGAVLDGVRRDFPELSGRVDEAVRAARTAYGAAALREILALRDAGADPLARRAAALFPTDGLDPGIVRQVAEIREGYDARDRRADMARLLFDGLHAELTDADRDRFAPFRPELAGAITAGTVARLDPFLEFAEDDSLPPADRLALAYSGWAAGAGGADTDPDRAVTLWRARRLLAEFLAATDATRAGRLREELTGLEGADPRTVRSLVPNLRPWLETDAPAPGGLAPAGPFPVTCAAGFGADGLPGGPPSYSVVLPPEYSPDGTHPALVALGPYSVSPDAAARFWGVTDAGGAVLPGPATTRGFVVICPDLAGTTGRRAGGIDGVRHPYGDAQVGAVRAVVEDARRRFALDADRCYLAGHWSGGDAALDVGLELPDVFAGVAAVCGSTHKFTNVLEPNAAALPLYVVGGQIDRDVPDRIAPQLRDMMIAGDDVTYVEYFGRGTEQYGEENANILDWFLRHRRDPYPEAIDARVLRPTGRRKWWVETGPLPASALAAGRSPGRGRAATLSVEATAREGNLLVVRCGAKPVTVWLSPELVDYETRVDVRMNNRRALRDFLRPELDPLLDDLKARADRRMTFTTRLEL